ncbi:kinase domain-containing protein [Pochonia chlamydosporia 170]|uniref:non-specific serine/threonine protein kinase n=1 Tax=Pochonia chlamydosporia 170 TaxID=1380566 RepID=A0A179FSK3_METCM|nr:kinase domain-containing protein [Pochonia chlamydosporia 170]OAQ68592.1 kinase domain-containing protein [Pochonia chlamydosporia 170]
MFSAKCRISVQSHTRAFSSVVQSLRSPALYEPAFKLCTNTLRPPFSAHFSSVKIQLPEYKWIDGAENLEKYTKGGYHPVQIGDILHHRYEVVDKLGFGGWSTVWLSHDLLEKEYVAVKIGIADSLPHEVTTLRALATPTAVQACEPIPLVLDEFRIQGPNGSHPCCTTPVALCNLRECSFSRLFRLDVARTLAYELTLAVALVHSRGYVHGDIHLRNVLVRAPQSLNKLSIQQFRDEYGQPDLYPVERTDGHALPPCVPSTAVVPLYMGKTADEFTLADAHLLLSDFGVSFSPASQVRLGQDCHTPVDFRPPEARFEPNSPLSFSVDVWSLSTAIWDILGMRALFSSAFYSERQVMCQIVDTLGPMPASWLANWEDRTDFFDDQGVPAAGRYVWPKLAQAFEERVQKFRRDDDMGVFSPEETEAILEMMAQMLKFRPEERPTVEQVLESRWMVSWALPDYRRGQVKS